MPIPTEAMRRVARRLNEIDLPFAFVGGAVVGVLVDHPELLEIRPTKDVDVIVEVGALVDYYALEDRLRAAGFQHDITENAPICRWIIEECRVDVMPTRSVPLGMDSQWFPEALASATTYDLGQNCWAPVIQPPLFLATKLSAFEDRGNEDYYGSPDLEDIITLVDGRGSIVEDCAHASDSVRQFVAIGVGKMLQQPDFQDAFPGHLADLSRTRAPLVMKRLKAIAALAREL